MREIWNKIMNLLERRLHYGSDDEVVSPAVQQSFDDLIEKGLI